MNGSLGSTTPCPIQKLPQAGIRVQVGQRLQPKPEILLQEVFWDLPSIPLDHVPRELREGRRYVSRVCPGRK